MYYRIFNPFRYIAGLRALVYGWSVMLITGCLAFFSKTHFDGVIDVHTGLFSPFPYYLLEQLIAWGLAVIPFYLAGYVMSKSSIRFIDVAGTLALARWPLIFLPLINLALPIRFDLNHIDPIFVIIALVNLVFVVWFIALMYNAVCTSCNLKGKSAIVLFISTLIFSEMLSKFVFHLLYNQITNH